MKVKKAFSVMLTNEPYNLNLNQYKGGDTVIREVIIEAYDSITIENGSGMTQKVINAATLDVEEYSEGPAIIPCEGLSGLLISGAEGTTVDFMLLV